MSHALAVVSLLAAGLCGCVGETMRLGPTPDATRINPPMGRHIKAQASGFQLFWVLPIATNSRHARAMESLREQAGNDNIADVTITDAWYYAVVGTVYTTRMEATAYARQPRQ